MYIYDNLSKLVKILSDRELHGFIIRIRNRVKKSAGASIDGEMVVVVESVGSPKLHRDAVQGDRGQRDLCVLPHPKLSLSVQRCR